MDTWCQLLTSSCDHDVSSCLNNLLLSCHASPELRACLEGDSWHHLLTALEAVLLSRVVAYQEASLGVTYPPLSSLASCSSSSSSSMSYEAPESCRLPRSPWCPERQEATRQALHHVLITLRNITTLPSSQPSVLPSRKRTGLVNSHPRLWQNLLSLLEMVEP